MNAFLSGVDDELFVEEGGDAPLELLVVDVDGGLLCPCVGSPSAPVVTEVCVADNAVFIARREVEGSLAAACYDGLLLLLLRADEEHVVGRRVCMLGMVVVEEVLHLLCEVREHVYEPGLLILHCPWLEVEGGVAVLDVVVVDADELGNVVDAPSTHVEGHERLGEPFAEALALSLSALSPPRAHSQVDAVCSGPSCSTTYCQRTALQK
mmetsp:Transcript_1303/g.4681  ORF Transcript_1303/g.4681 Transcript_1303/m.4681 type:complete len:209 (-) Transcript_1303:34-660(-)